MQYDANTSPLPDNYDNDNKNKNNRWGWADNRNNYNRWGWAGQDGELDRRSRELGLESR